MEKIKEIAKQISDNLMIPFIGAGASFEQLNTDWDGICNEMANELSIENVDNIETAQKYLDKNGKKSFTSFLKKFLEIKEFNDEKGTVHLFLTSINCYYYYSTNQDNIFEKCLLKYGRNFNTIHTPESFRDQKLNYITLYKFHGDLDHPETIVFTLDDYRERNLLTQKLQTYNPLDLRLISDAISKSFLFIGYSFRDPNVMEIFEHLRKAFSGHLPESYLIEYEGNNEFESKMLNGYGIKCFNPQKYFPNKNKNEAFNSFLSKLSEYAYGFDLQHQMEDAFGQSDRNIIPIAFPMHCKYLKKYLRETKEPVQRQIEKFRKTYDGKNIPTELHQIAKESIIKIIKQIKTKDEVFLLNGCLFNLNINSRYALEMQIEYFHAIKDLYVKDSFERIQIFNLNLKQLPSNFKVVAVAMTFNKIHDEGIPVPQSLLAFVSTSIHSSQEIEELEEDYQNYVKYWFNFAYRNSRSYGNPLKNNLSGFGRTSFENILNEINNRCPKAIKDKPK